MEAPFANPWPPESATPWMTMASMSGVLPSWEDSWTEKSTSEMDPAW